MKILLTIFYLVSELVTSTTLLASGEIRLDKNESLIYIFSSSLVVQAVVKVSLLTQDSFTVDTR